MSVELICRKAELKRSIKLKKVLVDVIGNFQELNLHLAHGVDMPPKARPEDSVILKDGAGTHCVVRGALVELSPSAFECERRGIVAERTVCPQALSNVARPTDMDRCVIFPKDVDAWLLPEAVGTDRCLGLGAQQLV